MHHFFLTKTLPLAALLGVAACASAPRPQARAEGVARTQCDASAASQDALVRSLHVLSVEPIYAHIRTNNTSEERVSGARLIVRPPPGMSTEEMTRALQCHGARMLLGQAGTNVPNDPSFLPDRWVSIEVVPANGNFAIVLTADTVSDNLQVYGRANHYADEHMLATDPGL